MPWVWALGLCLLYATVAVRRHQLLRTTGYDLGIFEQAVRAYAELRAPVAPLRGEGFNLLGDHFHPLLAALAPLYRLWPSPLTLLVVQSALLALAVVPLARWAARALGRRAAHAVAAGYGLSWGVASAAAFDFHEVALAVPLLAFSLEALGHRRWRAAVGWAAPLLLVKEDLGLTLAAVGGYIALKGRTDRRALRLGLATVAAGLLGSFLEIKVLLPALDPTGGYAHGGNLAAAHGSLLGALAHAPLDLLRPETKATTLVLVFAPSALLALRSPLALIALPTLAWRMASENGFHWSTAFHYSAILMPVVFAGLVDVLGRETDPRRLRAPLATVLAVTAVLLPSFPLAQLAQRATWHTPGHVRAARALLDEIPDGATVAASNRLAPQLTSRCTVVLFPTFPVGGRLYAYPRGDLPAPTAEWIVHDSETPEAWPYKPGHWPYPLPQQLAELRAAQREHGYELVARRDGITLLHRTGTPRTPS
ncbi:membrane protein [Streptomyces showdoensis]|uniref:Membrane protein n=1 Tax=Streptomyces showdoensis TaxID=68268 RepID=A0A2P2GL70_STREW|nr:membrane protein [Streptomyces showdoensis]